MLKWKDNQKGFSLIELIVSIAILAMITMPITGLFLQSVKTNVSAAEVLRGEQVAQSYLEKYKAQGMSGLSGITENSSITVNDAATGFDVILARGANIPINEFGEELKLADMDLAIELESQAERQAEVKCGINHVSPPLFDNNEIRLDINDSTFSITINGTNYNYTKSSGIYVKLALLRAGSSAVNLQIYNNTPQEATLYEINGGGTNAVSIGVQMGNVSIVSNNVQGKPKLDTMCPLTITVTKKDRVLAETHVIIR